MTETMSMPVVSADGQEALFAWRWSAGKDAGAYTIRHVRRNAAGGWDLVGELTTILV
jgi:hypothetical protein